MAGEKFAPVFDRLRSIMEPYGRQLDVVQDEAAAYRVNTRQARADGYVLMFGAVEVRARYVAYHLMPVYVWPDLLDGVSPVLRRRMQGKSCFNFTAVDEDLFAELGELTRRGFERGAARGGSIFTAER
jgi:hypothetical protein